MKNQIISFYKLMSDSVQKFTDEGLDGRFFMDIYRSQPLEPETYEYYSLPAIFVDYTMAPSTTYSKGRTVTLTLHIVLDDMPDMSSLNVDLTPQQVSQILQNQQLTGFDRCKYSVLLQEILDGAKLWKTTALKFLSEEIVDEPVINYHVQKYEYDVYLRDMIKDEPTLIGEWESMIINGILKNKK